MIQPISGFLGSEMGLFAPTNFHFEQRKGDQSLLPINQKYSNIQTFKKDKQKQLYNKKGNKNWFYRKNNQKIFNISRKYCEKFLMS